MALYAFDGTLNFRDRKAAFEIIEGSQYGAERAHRRATAETNVHRFRELFGGDCCEYIEGVGTRFGWLGAAIGGAFGAGSKARLRRMYKALAERYHEGDDKEIDIVGFSRGAAMAVVFTNIIDCYGIRHPCGPKHWLPRYRRGLGWTWRFPKADERTAFNPKIRFLGLFDAVATFGIPIGFFRNLAKKWFSHIPKNVELTFHAMALDEVRATFELVRPQPNDPDRLYEVWFRGVHSNIGGGYPDRGLSDIALAWMMEMFLFRVRQDRRWYPKTSSEAERATEQAFEQTLRQISPDPGDSLKAANARTETLEPNPNGEVYRPPDVIRQPWRPLPLRPKVHHSVFLRTENLVNDHNKHNQRLIRFLPHNLEPVYDPPFFYETREQSAARGAEEIFGHVPVRPQDWLTVEGERVVRSDDWVAVGRERGDWDWVISDALFIRVTTQWLLAGRPEDHRDLPLPDPPQYEDKHNKEPLDAGETAEWVLRVLAALEPYVPALWRHNAPPLSEFPSEPGRHH